MEYRELAVFPGFFLVFQLVVNPLFFLSSAVVSGHRNAQTKRGYACWTVSSGNCESSDWQTQKCNFYWYKKQKPKSKLLGPFGKFPTFSYIYFVIFAPFLVSRLSLVLGLILSKIRTFADKK